LDCPQAVGQCPVPFFIGPVCKNFTPPEESLAAVGINGFPHHPNILKILYRNTRISQGPGSGRSTMAASFLF
jgi:hypothetical protein